MTTFWRCDMCGETHEREYAEGWLATSTDEHACKTCQEFKRKYAERQGDEDGSSKNFQE